METEIGFWQEVANNLLGGMSLAYFFSTIIFILIGAFLNICLDVYNRDKNSDNTPVTFDIGFFWKDNWFRIALNLVIAFVAVRFFSDFFPGMQIGMFWAFVLGLLFDWMIVVIREVQYKAKKKLKEVMNG